MRARLWFHGIGIAQKKNVKPPSRHILFHVLNALTVTVMFSVGLAGTKDGGGGDAIVCGKKGFMSSRTVQLADIHNMTNGPATEYRGLTGFKYSVKIALETEMRIFKKVNPSLAAKVEEVLPQLRFEFVKQLEELDDDGIAGPLSKRVATIVGTRTWKCEKTQLAIQDRSTKIVRIRKDLYDDLDTSEQALLQIHEAVIFLNPGAYDTTSQRNLVAEIFRKSTHLY
jgi:hypothetical protein